MSVEPPLMRDVLNGVLNSRVDASGLYSAFPATQLTTAELAAGVTPTNYAYEPGDVRRYGGIFDGVTDDGPAWQRACDVASRGASGNGPGGGVFAPRLPSMISTAVLITVPGDGVMTISAYGCRIFTTGAIAPFSVTGAASRGGLDVCGLIIDHQSNATALYGMDVYFAWNVRWISCQFLGGTRAGYAGLRLRNGTAANDGTGSIFCQIIECNFYGLTNAMPNGVILQGAANATNILNSQFNGTINGVYMTPETALSTMPNGALIMGCAFETYVTAIYSSNNAGANQEGLRIIGNRFENGASEVFNYGPVAAAQPAYPPFLAGNYLVSNAGAYITNVNGRYYNSMDFSVTPSLPTAGIFQNANPIKIQPTGGAARALNVYCSTTGTDTGMQLLTNAGVVLGDMTHRTGAIGRLRIGEVVLDQPTPTVAAGQIAFGTTTTTTATAGAAGALPATPRGYVTWNLGGTDVKVPYYNV